MYFGDVDSKELGIKLNGGQHLERVSHSIQSEKIINSRYLSGEEQIQHNNYYIQTFASSHVRLLWLCFCTTFLLCNKINFQLHVLSFITAMNVLFSFSYHTSIFIQQQKTSENSTSQSQGPSVRMKGYALILRQEN